MSFTVFMSCMKSNKPWRKHTKIILDDLHLVKQTCSSNTGVNFSILKEILVLDPRNSSTTFITSCHWQNVNKP